MEDNWADIEAENDRYKSLSRRISALEKGGKMGGEIVTKPNADIIENVIAQGDLSKLSAEERVLYYRNVCESLGLNPFTKPFEYITLNGRLTLYARKDATDQLRKSQCVNIAIINREQVGDVYVVTAQATTEDGRKDESIGAVSTVGLKGDALANALMKAETKAKRRVTLSICGLGWSDETEIETIPNVKKVDVDAETGEIKPQTWVTEPESIKRFEAWAHGTMALSGEDIHKALDVSHLNEFTGSKQEAMNLIEEYVNKKVGK